MAAAGTVEKQACAEDGRGQLVAITEAGRALRHRMWPIYADAIEAAVGSKLRWRRGRNAGRPTATAELM
jgi:DNA-binding MarR family transcriptional regulator